MTREEREWLDGIVQLGCIVCRRSGVHGSPAAVHHLRAGVGMGQRSGHLRSIPLCALHHQNGGYGVAFHAGPKAFEKAFGTEEALLELTKDLMDEAGNH